MQQNKYLLLFTTIILIPFHAIADNIINKQGDYVNYCNHIVTKSNAEIEKLSNPDIFAKISKDDYNNQFISVGISKDYQDFRKKDNIRDIAVQNCNLYQSNLDVQEQLLYGLATVQKKILLKNLKLFVDAKTKLNILIYKIKEKIEANNETIMTLYNIEYILQKLEIDERLAQTQVASIQVPKIDVITIENISELIKKSQIADIKLNNLHNEFSKTNNWDISLFVGMKKNLTGNTDFGSFFSINAKYNIGSDKSNKLIDKSEQFYKEWKINQKNGFNEQLELVKNKVDELIEVEKQNLENWNLYKINTYKLLDKIEDVGSAVAERFRVQLEANIIVQNLEIDLAKNKIDMLNRYKRYN